MKIGTAAKVRAPTDFAGGRPVDHCSITRQVIHRTAKYTDWEAQSGSASGPVDEPVETVDSPTLLLDVCRVPPRNMGMGVQQVQVSDVPTTFDESVVLLDVREDDEWHVGTPRAHSTSRWARCPPGWRDRFRRDAVRCLPSRRSLPAGRSTWRRTATPVNVSGGMQAWADAGRPVVTDSGASAPSEQPSLGWSDDPGVFPLRDAVERAGPAARLVPAVQRHPAGAVGHATAVGVERATNRAAGEPERSGRPERPAAAAAGYRWIAVRPGAAPPRPPAPAQPGPDPALCA